MPVKIIHDTIHSVKGVVYRKSQNNFQYLITLESDTNMVSFPGGAQDIDDETIQATMIRELQEELGLTENSYRLYPTHISHEFMHTDVKNKERYGKKGIQHIFLVEYNGAEEIKKAEDLTELKWADKNEVLKLLENAYEYWIPLFSKAADLIERQT